MIACGKLLNMDIPLIDQTLMLADQWHIVDSETFMAYNIDDGTENIVKASFLAEEHPLLPDAIRGLINWSYMDRTNQTTLDHQDDFKEYSFAEGKLVGHTVDLLQNGGMPVTDINNNTYLFTSGLTIDHENATESIIPIVGSAVTHQHVFVSDKKVPFVTNAFWKKIDVSKTALEQQYPDWETRYRIGSELGMENFELMPYVFSKPSEPLPSIEASSITFK